MVPTLVKCIIQTIFQMILGLNCGCMVGTVGMLGGGLGYGRLKPDVVAQAERVWCVLTSTMLYLRSGP